MKFLFLIFALVLVTPAKAEICMSGRSANLKYDGTVENPEKCFINVLNKEGSTIAAGSVVIADVSNDDGASVIIDTSTAQTPLCIMEKACSSNKVCRCQTYGLYDSALYDAADGTATAGAPFFIATGNAGYIRKGTAGGVEIPGGIFYDAPSATGATQVFIKMR